MRHWVVGSFSAQVTMAAVGMTALMIAVLMIVDGVPDASMGTGPPEPSWRGRLASLDAALARRDWEAAGRQAREAYVAALGARSWEGLVAAGDAALRVGEASNARAGAVPLARRAYLAALFRARAVRSLDGVLRATEAFAELDDHEVAEQGLGIAQGLARRDDERQLARVHDLAERLAERSLVAGGVGPTR